MAKVETDRDTDREKTQIATPRQGRQADRPRGLGKGVAQLGSPGRLGAFGNGSPSTCAVGTSTETCTSKAVDTLNLVSWRPPQQLMRRCTRPGHHATNALASSR